jgi:hypothetical protein
LAIRRLYTLQLDIGLQVICPTLEMDVNCLLGYAEHKLGIKVANVGIGTRREALELNCWRGLSTDSESGLNGFMPRSSGRNLA